MCGIAGMFTRSGREPVSESTLRQMLALLRHRGPDEFGMLLDHEAALGSARLSIIDLGGGTQPIANEDQSLWIVFNGEIFNYPELRADLESRGHVFRTSTDTEVILHLFEEHGPECLTRMNGQFALAIWDTRLRRLFLARDRLGVRPLFYAQARSDTLVFASEIKAILADRRVRAELAPEIVSQIFTFWAPLGAQTVFRGISALPPGHFLIADSRSLTVRRYWQLQFPTAGEQRAGRFSEDTNAIAEQFRELLIDACRIRLRADVPVGAYLSGGLDSSVIAAIVRRHTANRLVTFSIAFSDAGFDESVFQKQMAAHLGTEHHVARVTHEDIGAVFPEVIWHAETPLMRTAPAPMFLLSKLVRQHDFKVVLTGEGADEFLAGYDLFKEDKIRRFWAREPLSERRPQLLRRLYHDILGPGQIRTELLAGFFGTRLTETNCSWYSHAVRWHNSSRNRRFLEAAGPRPGEVDLDRQLADLCPEDLDAWDDLARAQFWEITTFLSPYLLSSQGDRMGMAHSVEGRFPFLDCRLVDFCNRLPSRLKLRSLNEKHLLKKAAQPWLPEGILRRPKRAYRAPIQRSFFNPAAADYVEETLAPGSLKDAGLFKVQPVQQLLNKLRSGSPASQTDEMALTGIISTQLTHQLFVKNFPQPRTLSSSDRVKVCRLMRPCEQGLAMA